MEINTKLFKKMSDKYGYKFDSIIGYGNNGMVFDIGENKNNESNVLKLTYSPKEGIAANKLIGYNEFKNVVKIYRVFRAKINDATAYFIEMEKLKKARTNSIMPEILEYLRNYDQYKDITYSNNKITEKSDNPEETEELLSMYNNDENQFINYTYYKSYWTDVGLSLVTFLHNFSFQRKLFNDLVNGLKELYSIGIYHIDIHVNNIMKRKRDYILTDITSESLENLLPLVNQNEFIPLVENKIQYARTAKEKHQGLRNIELNDWSGLLVFTDVNAGDVFVGEDCLFDIRIAFIDANGKILSVGIIKKGTGRVIAPSGTFSAVESAEADDYKFIVGSYFKPSEQKLNFITNTGLLS